MREEIAKFLNQLDAEVLCMRGKWGAGKTYTWAHELKEARKSAIVKVTRYSYVSLFGINSLDELKFSIFENIVTLGDGVPKADLHTLDAFINSKLGSWRGLTRIAQTLPVVRSVLGGDATSFVSFMTIQDQISASTI